MTNQFSNFETASAFGCSEILRSAVSTRSWPGLRPKVATTRWAKHNNIVTRYLPICSPFRSAACQTAATSTKGFRSAVGPSAR
eukprot:scaffold302378_cov41-Prasinocladus_malaysianus.AAC.1